MERLIEGVPGEPAEVWVQDRGGGPLRQRGTVVIEDLREVLTSISSPTGANGPLNPVTQYMLAQAADQLAERLTNGSNLGSNGESVPRLLSTALGHQPFVETVLGMSQHQMLRRWPVATAWYSDVINYLLRPARFLPQYDSIDTLARGWASGTFGDFARQFGDHVISGHGNERHLRVAEALQALWPDFGPVHRALAGYRRELGALWAPIYLAALRSYGLVPRPGIDVDEVTWAMNAMNSRELLERLSGFPLSHTDGGGRAWTLTSWSTILLVAGACTDEEGRSLSPGELEVREAVRPFALPS